MSKMSNEIFVVKGKITAEIFRKVNLGLLRKLCHRVYTTNLIEKPESIIRRHAWVLVEEFFPGALIVDRTAFEHRPSLDGSIFVVANKKRAMIFPGLAIYSRKGVNPLPEDRPFMGKLYLSCPARAYLENMRTKTSSQGSISRTLSRKEIEEKLEFLLCSVGSVALQDLRKEACRLAPLIGAQKEYDSLNALIGTLLGTRKEILASPLTRARMEGEPYDPKRIELFQKLFQALQRRSECVRTIRCASEALPFFESYFSNFIEGTEFELEEAAKIIFEKKMPQGRPADAHDILGTFQIASDENEMQKIPQSAEGFFHILKNRHATLMQGRPEMNPGEFKTKANRAGSTFFVAPELVLGTLRKGFVWLEQLEDPLSRAIYVMFLVAEVHPFLDGNGRCARLMMNAELVARGQARIIVPTVFRANYLMALKSLTHNEQPESLIRVLDFAQNYTSRIDWSDYETAKRMLLETHAFEDSTQAELMGIRLILPIALY